MLRDRIEAEPFGYPRLRQFDDAPHGSFRIVRLYEIEIALGSGRAEIRHRTLVDAVGSGDDFNLVGLTEPLRRAAGWRAQQKARAFRRKDAQDRVDDDGLTDARRTAIR